MDVQEIKKFAKEMLSEKRYKHTEGVAYCAKDLADICGANPEFAVIAGFLHDIQKEASLEEMQELTKNLDLDNMTKSSKALLHGAAAAEFAKNKFNINDEIYNACFYHTTGRENMTPLEKVIYLADAIEPNRKFDNLEPIRKIAKKDLDTAVLWSINRTLRYLIDKDLKIHSNTIKARNYLLKY